MQNKEQIFDFLKGKLAYNEAVSLFLVLSNKHTVANMLLSIGDNVTNRTYLLNYFRSQIDTVPAPVEQLPPIEETNSSIPELKFERSIPADSIQINSIRVEFDSEWKQAYRQRGHLHGRLHEAVSDEVRYEIAKELMSIQKKINELNLLKAEFDKGIIPQKFLTEKLSAQTYTRIQRLRFYIQREEKKLLSCKDSESIKIQSRIENFKKELNSLL